MPRCRIVSSVKEWEAKAMVQKVRLPVLRMWLACALLSCPALCSAAERHGKIELLRDRWGVPHVFAATDAGAMYGLGGRRRRTAPSRCTTTSASCRGAWRS
jgi:hypothetical protein